MATERPRVLFAIGGLGMGGSERQLIQLISSTHPDLVGQIATSKSASCLEGVVDTAEAAWNPAAGEEWQVACRQEELIGVVDVVAGPARAARERLPVRRRHPADLPRSQQGYPKVLGRSLR